MSPHAAKAKTTPADRLRLVVFFGKPPIQGRYADAKHQGRLFLVAAALSDCAKQMGLLLLPEKPLEWQHRSCWRWSRFGQGAGFGAPWKRVQGGLRHLR